MTPDEAAAYPCPVSRTFAAAQPTCRGTGCILWRWHPVTASDPRFQAALKARIAETGEKSLQHPKAAALARGDVPPDSGYPRPRWGCGVSSPVEE
jgi:hypothetical protein